MKRCNRSSRCHLPMAGLMVMLLASSASAQGYARAGWVAELETLFHDVSGRVIITDEFTLSVEHFSYDGGGIEVFFYLAPEDSFGSYSSNGVAVGDDLLGMVFDDDSLTVPVPMGMDGYDAVSVWCMIGANFGSGPFLRPGDANGDGQVDVGDLGILAGAWGISDGSAKWADADFSGDGQVDVSDLGILAGNWQDGVGVPEPATGLLLAGGLAALLGRRRLRSSARP